MSTAVSTAPNTADTATTEPRGIRGGLRQWQAAFEYALIVIGIAALGFMPRRITSDGFIRLQTISALLDSGKLLNERYSLVGPLFSTPLYLLGGLHETPGWWLQGYNYCLFVLGLLAIFLLLRNRMDRGVLRAFLLVLIAASMFPNHLVNYYGEVFTALCVGVGVIAAVLGPRLAGWVAVVLGVVNTPATLLALGCTVVVRALQTRRVRYGLALVAAVGLFCLENYLRRGAPLDGGYAGDAGPRTVLPYSGRPGFSYPFLFGLLSILFSFGKGLVFFVPGLFLPVRRLLLRSGERYARELVLLYALWIAFVVGLVLLYARWYGWDGGWFWGPRFFLIATLPAAFALAWRLRRPGDSLAGNVLTLAVFALTVWVSITGAVFGLHTLTVCQQNRPAMEPICNYTPEFSPLWRPFVAAEPITWQGVAFIAYIVFVALYLALPLLAKIREQLVALLPAVVRPYLALRSWRW